MSKLERSAEQASNSRAMAALARFGLTVRGVIYLIIGWLAVQIALGHHSEEANQRGALAEVARQPFGKALLWILGLGFAAYALRRLSEAAFGTAADGKQTGPRLKSLVRGIIYASLAVTTFRFIGGSSGQSQSGQQVSATAKVMKHTGGRWLVGLIGVIVIVVGVAMIIDGIKHKFEKDLRMTELHGTTRTVVVRLGMIGTIARGAVFAVAGLLVLEAAIKYEPDKSSGLDGALRTLAHQAYGPWLLGALALGLVAFGVYGLAAARYAKT
jgi:hypothetical protein